MESLDIKRQARSRFRSAQILLRLHADQHNQVLHPPSKSFSAEDARIARTVTGKHDIKSKRRLSAPFLPVPAATPLTSRSVASWSFRLLRTITGLWLLSQHPSQPLIPLALLPQVAPDDQRHEEEAEGQHLPPGLMMFLSHGMAHRPAARVGFAGGKLNWAVRVVLFHGGRLGQIPGTGQPMKASRSPAHELQRPDGPGRERAVSAPPARRCLPSTLRDLEELTGPPAHARRGSLPPGLCVRRRGAP